MEFVNFALCMTIIAQANAAALINGNSHYKFIVPEVARGGFEMILNAPIHKKVQEKIAIQSLAAKLEFEDGQGLHIYVIVQEEKQNELSRKLDELRLDSFNLRLKATKRPQPEKLLLQVFLNDDFQNEAETTFEQMKHISIEGLIEDVNNLHFDFTDEAIS